MAALVQYHSDFDDILPCMNEMISNPYDAKNRSQQISTLLNDRKAGGAAGHLDTVAIHKFVVPRMRSWLGNPQNYKNIKEKVLKAMEYPGMGAGNVESSQGSDPVKNARSRRSR